MRRDIRAEQLADGVDGLTDEVDRAARAAIEGEDLAGDIDWLVDEIGRATRAAVTEERQAEGLEAVIGRVEKAVRAAASGEKPEVVDTVVGGVSKTVRDAFHRGSGAADLVSRGLRGGLRQVRKGVRGVGRDNVVMVRVSRESQQRMDELTGAHLFGSRSEAAAFLIEEGIKARRRLFDGIAARIDAIKKTEDELQRLLEEEGSEHA